MYKVGECGLCTQLNVDVNDVMDFMYMYLDNIVNIHNCARDVHTLILT